MLPGKCSIGRVLVPDEIIIFQKGAKFSGIAFSEI
jgi:hypothetical protein